MAEKERSNDESRWEVVRMLQWGTPPGNPYLAQCWAEVKGGSYYEIHSGSGRA